MRLSRENVLALIKRWQSENCVIKVEFSTVDHSLEISCPPILYAHLDPLDDSSFWIGEVGSREGIGRIYGIHVKLTAVDGYEITNIPHETHPTFQLESQQRVIVRVPFGECGNLFIYEMESPKKVM